MEQNRIEPDILTLAAASVEKGLDIRIAGNKILWILVLSGSLLTQVELVSIK